MPFKAPPMTDQCEKCGWKQTVVPEGDVIQRLPSCLKCGHPLVLRMATKSEVMVAKLKGLLRR
jgi:hypothetical protein